MPAEERGKLTKVMLVKTPVTVISPALNASSMVGHQQKRFMAYTDYTANLNFAQISPAYLGQPLDYLDFALQLRAPSRLLGFHSLTLSCFRLI